MNKITQDDPAIRIHKAGATARGPHGLYPGAAVILTLWDMAGAAHSFALAGSDVARATLRELAGAIVRSEHTPTPPAAVVGEGIDVAHGLGELARTGKVVGWFYVNDRGEAAQLMPRLVVRDVLAGALDGESWCFVLWSDGTRSAIPFRELVPILSGGSDGDTHGDE